MDVELLELHRNGDESAFTELVRRHLPWIYGMARRRLIDGHLAQDVVQAVFVVLHRKGPRFSHDRAMLAWMHKVAWYVTSNVLRDQRRRHRHELAVRAAKPQTTDQMPPSIGWEELAPLLDEIIGRLGRTDREVILLRYYRDLSLAQVGTELGITQEAARKRIERALEKLRRLAKVKGLEVQSSVLLLGLSNLRLTPPPGLTATATGMATASPNSALAGATGSVVKGATLMMMMPKILIGTAAAFLIVGGMATVLVPWSSSQHPTTAMASDAGGNAGIFLPRAPGSPSPATAPAQNNQYPKLSPFSAVRWGASDYEVQVDGTWYKMLAINNVQEGDMQTFAEQKYGDLWQKRIDEDLVQVLTEMGNPPGDSVSFQLQTLDTNQAVILQNVPMTHENRNAIMAIRNPTVVVPSNKPFTAIRWLDHINAIGLLGLPDVQVEVNGVWYDLINANDCYVLDIERFARKNYGDNWRTMFETNLSGILADMRHPAGDTMQVDISVLNVPPPSVATQ